MKIKPIITLLVLLCFIFQCKPKAKKQVQAKSDFKVSFYNLENLFDAKDDLKTNDNDFLPNGYYHWNEDRYQKKLKNIAAVLTKIDADLIGLCEVENKAVLEDLVKLLPNKTYKIIHFESHDRRGIDNALLYTEDFDLKLNEDITARFKNNAYAGSRGILKAKFNLNGEELTVYVNHWSSRKGGKEKNRLAYATALSNEIKKDDSPNVIVMGDFNDTPTDSSIKTLLSQIHLENPFLSLALEGKGTATYKDDWYLFDQILFLSSTFNMTSFGIVDFEEIKNQAKGKYQGFPLRTFIGNRYNEQGCSDHFPVYLKLSTK